MSTTPPLAGEGRFIHTYQENADPLPSFEGEPRRVALTAPDARTLADQLWASLNEDNKVSLYVCYRDLSTGRWTPSSSTSTSKRAPRKRSVLS